MEVIGLTGGVGTGKSTVAGFLRELGSTVLDADQAAREVVEPGTDGLAEVVEAFGPGYLKDGRLDRARLAGLVFVDAEARRRLEAIVHPRVRVWMAEGTRAAAERGEAIVVQEIPLLFETGLDRLMSAVVVVWVPVEVQLRRLVEGQTWSEADARARIAAQLPIEQKRARADFVVDNSGSRDETRAQVVRLWATLRRRIPERG